MSRGYYYQANFYLVQRFPKSPMTEPQIHLRKAVVTIRMSCICINGYVPSPRYAIFPFPPFPLLRNCYKFIRTMSNDNAGKYLVSNLPSTTRLTKRRATTGGMILKLVAGDMKTSMSEHAARNRTDTSKEWYQVHHEQ